MLLACVLIPNFPLRLAVLAQPALDGLPLVLTSPSTNRPLVADASPEAVALGIRLGMPLREVHAVSPHIVFIPANPVRDGLEFEKVLRQLETVSPAIEPLEHGRCYVDLHGLGRHYPSEQEMAEALLVSMSPIFRPRVGLGPTRFTAWVAARMAIPGSVNTMPADQVRATLDRLPVNWLPVDDATFVKFDRLGLRTLADIRALAPSALQARFGPLGRDVHAWASGSDEASIVPRPILESVREEMLLPAPIASREMLMLAIRQIVQKAFGRPAMQHRQVRQARIRIMIEGGQSWEREFSFPQPLGPQRLTALLLNRLQAIELTGPAEVLHLDLIDPIRQTAVQELIPMFRPRQEKPLIEAARQLTQRYGESPLAHIVEVEPWSRIPERRFALINFEP